MSSTTKLEGGPFDGHEVEAPPEKCHTFNVFKAFTMVDRAACWAVYQRNNEGRFQFVKIETVKSSREFLYP